MTVIDRLMRKVVMLAESGCWVFCGALDSSGYGLIGTGGSGRIAKAHRVMFAHARGHIPEGLQVLHRCDVRCCVNPAHLFLGTLQDNMRDRNAKGRQARVQGESHGCHKLTKEQVVDIRRMHDSGISRNAIARSFGMSRYAIGRITRRVGWTHIPDEVTA